MGMGMGGLIPDGHVMYTTNGYPIGRRSIHAPTPSREGSRL